MFDLIPSDMKEICMVLAVIFCFVLYILFGYIPDNIKPKKIPIKKVDQNEEYFAIRLGIEQCKNINEMHEYYAAILQYKELYPDSKVDVKILLEQYDVKCSRF